MSLSSVLADVITRIAAEINKVRTEYTNSGYVTCATTKHETLSGLLTIDDVPTTVGMRVLVWNQVLDRDNGIYLAQTGAWVRAPDADTVERIAGYFVTVNSGTFNAGRSFRNVMKSTDILGTDEVYWLEQAGVYPGTIIMSAAGVVPPFHLVCDGSSLLRTDYPKLYQAIGVTFGSVDATHFNLPDMRDRLPIGTLGTRTIGVKGGSETKVLVSGNLPPHAHSINHGHSAASRPAAGALTSILAQGGGTATVVSNSAVNDFAGNSGNGPGTSTPMDIMPPTMPLHFIIRY